MSNAPRDTELPLSYSMFDLPSAQHKAGLAGLLLLIDSMRQRGLDPLPTVNDLTATSVKLTFTQAALQAVFDDLYDAELVETSSKRRWPKKDPKREFVRTGTVCGFPSLYRRLPPTHKWIHHALGSLRAGA